MQSYFNSQPHEEADNEAVDIVKGGGIISTHSLTKRLTALVSTFRPVWSYFNSQPHEEADWIRPLHTACVHYFNSQPHEEADL